MDTVEELQAVFRRQSIFELRNICVEIDGGSEYIKISGQVGSFYHKQLAQEIVRRTTKIPIDNQVVVLT